MRISKFEFENTLDKWRLMPVEFSDLTLLVGVSGVGKTRVLRSLSSLVWISAGKSKAGHKWSIEFTDEELRSCVWTGEFEPLDDQSMLPEQFSFPAEDGDDERKEARIVSELISVNGREVIRRDFDQIVLDGTKMPKLSPSESVVYLLKEEEEIKPIYQSFQRIIFSDRTELSEFSRTFALVNPEKYLKRHTDIDSIRKASLPALGKLYLADKIDSPVFSEIRSRLISVFPNVEDISFGIYGGLEANNFFANAPFVQLKERDVEGLVKQQDISSGMLRTLAHLSELFLSPPGTVILIDEFENSLGVNCIDAVTEDLLGSSSSLQFIITSHHPYIINNVGSANWKVVCRKGSVVRAIDADEMGIGISSHDAFLQLLNSEKYMSGISCVTTDA